MTLDEVVCSAETIMEMKREGFEFSHGYGLEEQAVMLNGKVVCVCKSLNEIIAFYMGYKLGRGKL